MNVRKWYLYIKGRYDLLTRKRYNTLAGTLVFFLIMSIVPLSFWLTLFLGRLPIDGEQILGLPVFASVKNVLAYVQKEAKNATASVSIVLLVTTLYSSTNLFYQMRRSGEIIYEYHRPRQGIRLRIAALILMFLIMLLVVAFVILFAAGTFVFSRILPTFWERVADYGLLVGLAFVLVLLLNMYICPHKAPAAYFLSGTFLTVGAWVLAVVGFAVYLKISNMDKLYGALSAIIVFLLWLYILMIGFVAGIVFNSEKIVRLYSPKANAATHTLKKRTHTVRMKNVKLKSSLLAGITALLFFLPSGRGGALPDITRPYLGEYECKSARLGQKDLLDGFKYVKLELKADNTFLVSYKTENGESGKETGKYSYDREREEITLTIDKNRAYKRKFPLKKGVLTVDVAIGGQRLVLSFEQP